MKLNSLMARADSLARREQIIEYTTSCIDENVIDIELPELVTFFQENNCQVVKDIGIDRVVHTQEKCLIENCKLEHNGSKSSIDPDCNKDVFKLCGSENLMQECEVDISIRDGISSDGFTKKTVNEKLLLAREVDTNPNPPHLSNFNEHIGEQKFDQVPSKEAVLVNSMVFSATEVIDNFSHANEASSKSEVESGSIIHEFDSSITTISSSREEEPQNANCKPHLEIGDMLEDDISERPTVSRQSSIIQHSYVEESSLSAVGPFSGPIVCSGRSYSGSISLRSNSSTTSTQSFAFPILSTEWNGSPVRMAKADPKHLRKHRGWRKCLFCCKF